MQHDERRVHVFFYGLFMDESLLRSKGIEPRKLTPASVKGFQISDWSASNTHPEQGRLCARARRPIVAQ